MDDARRNRYPLGRHKRTFRYSKWYLSPRYSLLIFFSISSTSCGRMMWMYHRDQRRMAVGAKFHSSTSRRAGEELTFAVKVVVPTFSDSLNLAPPGTRPGGVSKTPLVLR